MMKKVLNFTEYQVAVWLLLCWMFGSRVRGAEVLPSLLSALGGSGAAAVLFGGVVGAFVGSVVGDWVVVLFIAEIGVLMKWRWTPTHVLILLIPKDTADIEPF